MGACCCRRKKVGLTDNNRATKELNNKKNLDDVQLALEPEGGRGESTAPKYEIFVRTSALLAWGKSPPTPSVVMQQQTEAADQSQKSDATPETTTTSNSRPRSTGRVDDYRYSACFAITVQQESDLLVVLCNESQESLSRFTLRNTLTLDWIGWQKVPIEGGGGGRGKDETTEPQPANFSDVQCSFE